MIYGKHGKILALVLAGGRGERLMPLTKYRAKPAVPFAAKYRIVDFALSNLVNSSIFSIYVLVQFKSQSLNEHIERGWQFGGALRDRDLFVTVAPAQMWRGEHWYQGTCDAVFQNLHLVTLYDADHVLIFAADHIYKMDVEQMLDFHMAKGADVTVAANVVPRPEARQFGCIHTDGSGKIVDFVEKPKTPPEIPGKPGFTYVSMGNYIFRREALEGAVIDDSQDESSSHDFGRDILPGLHKKCAVYAYDFSTNVLPGKDRPYWKDVGTIKAYWDAHMDLCKHDSAMTLYNPKWPIRTVSFSDPPTYSYPVGGRTCSIVGSLRAEGSRILGAIVHSSVLSRNTLINSGAIIEESILGQDVEVGENARLKKVIVDAHNKIPPGSVIGYDLEEDRKRYHVDEESGVVVIGMPAMQLRKRVEIPFVPPHDR